MGKQRDDFDDAPVSGGIEAVLKAGKIRGWSDCEDQAILVASERALPSLANLYDRPLADVQRRRDQLLARAKRIGG